MQTIVGKIRIWDEEINGYKEGELELEDYTSSITFHDGSKNIIEIPENIEYFAEKDSEYRDIVYIKTHNDDIISVFSLGGAGRRTERFKLIEEHYEKLNNSLNNNQEEFLIRINKIVGSVSTQKDINQIVYNFVDKTNRVVFIEHLYLICFERLLFFWNGLGKLTLLTSKKHEPLLRFKSVVDGFEEDVDFNAISNYYDEYFMKLVKILDKRINFESEMEGIFVTWKLLLNEVRHYYYDLFHDEYGEYIPDTENLSLNECIRVYANIDLIDVNSGNNASIFTYYLMYLGKFEDNENYIECNNILLNNLIEVIEGNELDSFETSLLETSTTTEYSIDDIDLMTGHEFENFVSYLFHKLGYSSEVTKGSGDQGIDVIVEKNGRKIGVQTKCYSSSVTNKAIQEVVAGLRYYNLSKGIVVTNNYFTESARELAISNDVILWDRNILKEKILEVL